MIYFRLQDRMLKVYFLLLILCAMNTVFFISIISWV